MRNPKTPKTRIIIITQLNFRKRITTRMWLKMRFFTSAHLKAGLVKPKPNHLYETSKTRYQSIASFPPQRSKVMKSMSGTPYILVGAYGQIPAKTRHRYRVQELAHPQARFRLATAHTA